MSGLVRLKRLDLGTRRRGFGKASLVSFKVNPRLRLGLTLNSTRLAFLEASVAARGGGYQENGHAPSVVDNIGCKTSNVFLAILNTFETKTMVYVTI